VSRGELPGNESAFGRKRFRERISRCAKIPGWRAWWNQGASGAKLFVLCGIYQRHIWFQDAIDEFALLLLCGNRGDGGE
jgi:hypothetical protein